MNLNKNRKIYIFQLECKFHNPTDDKSCLCYKIYTDKIQDWRYRFLQIVLNLRIIDVSDKTSNGLNVWTIDGWNKRKTD